jgi:hypothetical protein
MLRSNADPSFGARMDSDVDAILRRWSAIIDLAAQHTAKLSSAIGDTRSMFAEIVALESWLDDIMAAHLSCELIVHNEVELGQFISNFQVSFSNFHVDLPYL